MALIENILMNDQATKNVIISTQSRSQLLKGFFIQSSVLMKSELFLTMEFTTNGEFSKTNLSKHACMIGFVESKVMLLA